MRNQVVTEKTEVMTLVPLGQVRRDHGTTYLDILEPFRPALKELEQFSHVQVLWWFSEFQDDDYRHIMQTEPPYDAPLLGMFACRSPIRPNPIGLTTVKILKINHEQGLVEIANIDAFDGTPVIDLKAYIPVCDRVQEVAVPAWCADWPDWMPTAGLGLDEQE
ncbi:MAG: tRNA (N6-threonylcarbamoyladenosine(37)-N6)-methyltransferase TrmO [Chloroflexota bacterium]